MTILATSTITVDFAGDSSGTAELTWGQREIWASIELAGHWIGLGGSMPLTPGTTVDEVAGVLRFVMSRHQALRTRFDCDERGRPIRQVVAPAGTAVLDVFDVDGQDPGEFAAALRWEYEGRDIDYTTDWPIQMGVVRHRGEVTHAVVMYNHLVLDGYGWDALTRDLANLGQPPDTPTGSQPLDQAAYQSSPAGRRHSEAAMRYWAQHLRTIPAQRNATPPTQPTPRYWQAGMRSRAAQLALSTIAARTQIDSSPVLMAAFAVSLARVSGAGPSVIRTVVSNRFRAGFAESVSVVNQSGLCVIDVADTTFDEVVVRAWRGSVGAGMHAYYDPRDLHALFATVARERGEDLDLSCFFNDARRTRLGASGEAVSATDLADALADSEFRWVYQQDSATERLFMYVAEEPSTLDYTISVDTWHWSPSDLEALVRGVEAILVEAAFEPGLRTGVSRALTPA